MGFRYYLKRSLEHVVLGADNVEQEEVDRVEERAAEIERGVFGVFSDNSTIPKPKPRVQRKGSLKGLCGKHE